MQTVELFVIAAAAIGLAALLAVRQRNRNADTHWPRIVLGVVPGLLGVLLVLVPLSDLVPDQVEGSIWLIVAVVISVVIVIGTIYRVARG